jgi:hypothetical protein
MVRSEAGMSLKNPVTLPGIDPGTVRLAAERLNRCATPGPLCENAEKYSTARDSTDDNRIRRMHSVCWKTKAENTHSEYVMLIAFPLQQWLPERSSILI